MQKIGKRKIIVLGLIGILLLFICNHYFIFYFRDKGLEQAVREYAVGSSLFVGMKDEPYKQFHKRNKPLKGFIPRKIVNQIDNVYLDLTVYGIKDIWDIKKFKSIEQFAVGTGGEGKRTGKKIDMPKNINSISTLKRLKDVSFSDINVKASEFVDEYANVDWMVLRRCAVDDYTVIEKFPNLKFICIEDMDVSSMEFCKQLNSLENLQLIGNKYYCSMEPLSSFQNLETLFIRSDTPEPFANIPSLNTVKELTLDGAGAPDKDNVEPYLQWSNLERLDLNDGYYEVKTKEWHDYGEK